MLNLAINIARKFAPQSTDTVTKGVQFVGLTDKGSLLLAVDLSAIRPEGTPERRRVQPGDRYTDLTGRVQVAEGYKLRNGKFGATSVDAKSDKPKGPYMKLNLGVFGEYELTAVFQLWVKRVGEQSGEANSEFVETTEF